MTARLRRIRVVFYGPVSFFEYSLTKNSGGWYKKTNQRTGEPMLYLVFLKEPHHQVGVIEISGSCEFSATLLRAEPTNEGVRLVIAGEVSPFSGEREFIVPYSRWGRVEEVADKPGFVSIAKPRLELWCFDSPDYASKLANYLKAAYLFFP